MCAREFVYVCMSHHHTYYVTSSYIPCHSITYTISHQHTYYVTSSYLAETVGHVTNLPYILCHINIHTVSHQHTYYVTSSYILCHIITFGGTSSACNLVSIVATCVSRKNQGADDEAAVPVIYTKTPCRCTVFQLMKVCVSYRYIYLSLSLSLSLSHTHTHTLSLSLSHRQRRFAKSWPSPRRKRIFRRQGGMSFQMATLLCALSCGS